MEYLKVKNWEEFQQYKDREPKWIKVYRTLLMDYKYEQLTDAEFGQLVKIWLLASQLDNQVPNDPGWIQRKTGMSGKPNIDKYLQLDFLQLESPVRDCTDPYSSVPRDREETETDTEKEKDLSSQFPDESSKEFQLATLLFTLIRQNDPKAKKPNLESWAKDINGIIRLDGRDPPEVEAVIKWCQQDPFWKTNILSAGKLRKQFQQLVLKMKGGNGHGKPEPERFSEKRYEGSDLDSLPWNQEG